MAGNYSVSHLLFLSFRPVVVVFVVVGGGVTDLYLSFMSDLEELHAVRSAFNLSFLVRSRPLAPRFI